MQRPHPTLVMSANVLGVGVGAMISGLCLGTALPLVAITGLAVVGSVCMAVGLGLIIWDLIARRQVPEQQPLLVQPAKPAEPIDLKPPAHN
jgi:hypothetical protein